MPGLPDPWIPDQQPPIGGNPIALSPDTFARFDRSARYTAEQIRLTAFQQRRGKTTWSAPGAWGWLAPGATITGLSVTGVVSGSDTSAVHFTLGQGTVTLCTRGLDNTDQAAAVTIQSETVTAYNIGTALSGAPGTGSLFSLEWVDAWLIGIGLGSGGLYWASNRSGPIAAATGSWPSLTPSSFTSDIYQDQGGGLVKVASSQIVRWFYKDTAAVNSLVPVEPTSDGNWDAIGNSCTAV